MLALEEPSVDTVEVFEAPPKPAPTVPLPEPTVHRFAFIIHPLHVDNIKKHPALRWTRFLPDRLVEAGSAWLPPVYLSRIKGGRSEATGQQIEGFLFSISATPRQILGHSAEFTYKRILKAVRQAEQLGARIFGLGAFTKVVGDAGVTVAQRADIPVTSGNSLTVAATLEGAKQAVRRMGRTDLSTGRAMVVGATGAIGSATSRLLAQACKDVVLVSIEPERLIALKQRIEEETPGAHVVIDTKADAWIGSCDLIVTATSAFGERVLDISQCKPGAVVCDVALPPDISQEEAAVRPDILIVESGEVLIPGEIDFGYDIGLPPGTAYACLAEAALLAMEGRFECYTLGREIDPERVKEMYRLFRKHGFRLAGLRSFGRYVTEEELAAKQALADTLRSEPLLFAMTKADASCRLARIPPKSKGVSNGMNGSHGMGWKTAVKSMFGM
jgi:predicted amino acid dehydrogenase